jgi:hypothetical protein
VLPSRPLSFANETNELQRDRAKALAEAGSSRSRPRQGLPSRSSFAGRIRPAFASLPPSRFALWRDKSRRYGAASFACIHERRMVDQTGASWNRIVGWLSQLDALETTLAR